MLKTRTWILIFAAVLLSCAAAMLLLRGAHTGSVAEIVQDGKTLRRIDLAQVTEPYSFPVECADGVNTITVEPGRIRVSDADCPDKVCVAFGWLSEGSVPILCMPHRLMIRIVRAGGADAASY